MHQLSVSQCPPCLSETFEITSPKWVHEFGRLPGVDRPNRIVVVFSYKVFVRGASASHAEMSQQLNLVSNLST
jgi:hypothetical protein